MTPLNLVDVTFAASLPSGELLEVDGVEAYLKWEYFAFGEGSDVKQFDTYWERYRDWFASKTDIQLTYSQTWQITVAIREMFESVKKKFDQSRKSAIGSEDGILQTNENFES